MSASPFANLRGLPYYDEPSLYLNLGNLLWAWEFNGWKRESLSWKQGCYVHTGLSAMQTHFTGPDLDAFFSAICVNSFAHFPVGTMKHAIMCQEDGLITSHGILQRNSPTECRFFAAEPWPIYKLLALGEYRVEVAPSEAYLTQVAGPTSLATLERATGENLRDIGFLRFRNATIAGKVVEIGRIGMSGNLAYEVRGPLAEGPEVYDAIYRAGKDLGIERLGWRTYLVNHVEGGFPQSSWTFAGAGREDAGYRAFLSGLGFNPPFAVTGSVDPTNLRARYRTPVEVGWTRAVRFDHEFVGRAALQAEVAHPRRTIVTLRWNKEDVLDIYASLLRSGEEYKTIDLPTSPTWREGMLQHADYVRRNGREVGFSSGTIYSYYFREVLSQAAIDVDLAVEGTELVVQWGDHGRRIKDVRATVARYPYLSEGRNDQIDARTLSG